MAKLPRDRDGWVKLLRRGWPRRAITTDVSRGLSVLVRHYLRADSSGRRQLRTATREPIEHRLWMFATLSAERAVRQKERDHLVQGLAALALGSERIDPRDILVAFSLLSHSAGKLRRNYRRLFEGARQLGGKEFAELVQDWLERTPEECSIDGMGFKVATDDRLFRYVDDDDDENDDDGFDAWWSPALTR